MRSADTQMAEAPKNRADEYTTIVDGRLVLVASLTLEQAQQALCDAYDLINSVEEQVANVTKQIAGWHDV